MTRELIKDMGLLYQMQDKFCDKCSAFSQYCNNCIITTFKKEIEEKLKKTK